MIHARRISLAAALLLGGGLSAWAQNASGPTSAALRAQFETGPAEQLPNSSNSAGVKPAEPASNEYYLSLEEAKSRVLEHSTVMTLTSLQVAEKCHALAAARKDYLPKLLTAFSYFHFDSDLGSVVTTRGIVLPQQINVPLIEQDAPMFTAAAIQPITPLLKVRQAVNIAAADVGTAEAQRADARRELVKGVEQLYFGLLASQQIRAGLEQAVAGAQQMAAAMPSPESQIDVIQAQQGLLEADTQVVTLTEQLAGLVSLPAGTSLKLEDPPRPTIPFSSLQEAVESATVCNPKLLEAQRQVDKAEAAYRVAQADFVPNVMAYAMYTNQDTTPLIQSDYTGVGVTATYLLEWGKKNDTLRQWQTTVCLARQNLRKETDDVRLSAAKAFHEANRAEQALDYAGQLAKLSGQVRSPANDPNALKAAAKAGLEAQVAAIKADMDYRTAVAELCIMTGRLD